LLACLIACYDLYYYIIFPLKENIVTRTAIGKESLTALYLNVGKILRKILKIKIKSNFDLEKEEKHTASL